VKINGGIAATLLRSIHGEDKSKAPCLRFSEGLRGVLDRVMLAAGWPNSPDFPPMNTSGRVA